MPSAIKKLNSVVVKSILVKKILKAIQHLYDKLYRFHILIGLSLVGVCGMDFLISDGSERFLTKVGRFGIRFGSES
jgi:hypothetical protein